MSIYWDKIILIYQVFRVVSRKTCSKTGILRFSFLNLHVCVFLWLTKACLCSFMFIPDTLIIESSFQINQVVEQQFCWLWTLNIMAENRISRWYERFSLFSSWSLKQLCTNLKLSTHTICFSKTCCFCVLYEVVYFDIKFCWARLVKIAFFFTIDKWAFGGTGPSQRTSISKNNFVLTLYFSVWSLSNLYSALYYFPFSPLFSIIIK